MSTLYEWSRPESEAPEDFIEYNAIAFSHVLTVFFDSNGDWRGVITELGTWQRKTFLLDAKNDISAKRLLERHYLDQRKQRTGH